ncbi:MAG: molybdenum cofactor guanylyltransferase [Verrucomicrobiales bacterium]|nr:molybdenum cofactor guanylyltransferase [Verrucomicrobiales bacterium]MCP5527649.1 molybdenum cofactor guanylyltransferase [Verrucomicrobiales bacterium]
MRDHLDHPASAPRGFSGGPRVARSERFSAVLLAGGQSRRMGRDKAWLEVDGQPLIVRQLALIRELAPDEIFIAARARNDYANLGVPVLADRHPGQGPLAGMERALALARCDRILVLAVDLPCMTTSMLAQVLAAGRSSGGAVPRVDGRLEPLAACYPAAARAIAAERLDAGQNSARGFALACREHGLIRVLDLPSDAASTFANWNLPDDVQVGPARMPRES